MTFVKGQSGNPAGRRPGSRNKVTQLMDELMQERSEELTRRLMDNARLGNGTAIRVYFDRMYPRRRGVPIEFALPEVRTAADVPAALAAICQGLASGELTPPEVETLARSVEIMSRALKVADADARLRRLEVMVSALARHAGIEVDLASATDLQADCKTGSPDGAQRNPGSSSRDHGAARLDPGYEGAPRPLASATDLQADCEIGSPDGAQRNPRSPSPDCGAARLDPGYESAPPPLASATDLQADCETGNRDRAQRNPGSPSPDHGATRPDPGYESAPPPTPDDPDDRGAWMRDFLGPEVDVPWHGFGQFPPKRAAG
jgi:hypothetical protein